MKIKFFEILTAYTRYIAPLMKGHNNLEVDYIHYEYSIDISNNQMDWALQLVFENMMNIYLESGFSMSRKIKKKEMTSRKSKYIFIYKNSEPLGFIHYQLTETNDPEVPMCIYCYELQIHSRYQRKGFGKLLMHLLEQYTIKKYHRNNIALTVQSKNHLGIEFYKSLGYNYHIKAESFIVMIKKVDVECHLCLLKD